ncbi:MAG: formate dehydrogenase accessory protein FdhE [Desulfocapsaceae bacterium]
MDKPESSSVENIRKAAGSLKELRPHYRNVLDYYEQLLIAQEMVKDALALSPIEDSHGLPKEEAEKSMVLANISAISFDKELTRDLMEKMCDLRRTAGSSSATLTNKFKAIINADGFEFETFIRDFLSRNGDAMNHLASVYGLDREFLFHVTYHSLQPSIQSWANGAAAFLPENFSWNKGVCPVCGERPALATIDDQGKRFLHCSFCWQKWHVNRGLCPVCDNHDPEFLQYFYSEEEAEYRVELCEKCKTYIKCIDSRNTERQLYPPLEHVVTLHLDMSIQKKGYTPSSDVSF